MHLSMSWTGVMKLLQSLEVMSYNVGSPMQSEGVWSCLQHALQCVAYGTACVAQTI